MLILPYHGSRIFVRALQLIDLSDSGDKWHWLEPLQKTRTPLPSFTIINQATKDNGFLKLICDHVINATKIYLDKANNLNTLYAFFTIVVVGTIEHSSTVTDVQFNHILPALLKGLPSQVPDFAASSYMIFSKLITKINLQQETIDKLMLKSVKKSILTQEVVLLILFLYDNPFNSLSRVSESLMLKLSTKSWFVDAVVNVKKLGVNILNFTILLLNVALSYIAKNAESEYSEEVKKLVNDMFTRIPLDEDEVLLILQKTLTDDVISEENCEMVKAYFINLYRSIERKYPNSSDKYLQDLMNFKEQNSSKISAEGETQGAVSMETVQKLLEKQKAEIRAEMLDN